MSLLLDDLLDMSRITRGQFELKKDYVELKRLVSVAVETARPLIDSKQHQLVVSLPNETITLEADPLRLSQVIANLLTNAAKYTDPQGRIELQASRRKRRAGDRRSRQWHRLVRRSAPDASLRCSRR